MVSQGWERISEVGQIPYRQATAMLKEVLPQEKGISFSGARNRIRTIGKQLDADVERDIFLIRLADVRIRQSRQVAARGNGLLKQRERDYDYCTSRVP